MAMARTMARFDPLDQAVYEGLRSAKAKQILSFYHLSFPLAAASI